MIIALFKLDIFYPHRELFQLFKLFELFKQAVMKTKVIALNRKSQLHENMRIVKVKLIDSCADNFVKLLETIRLINEEKDSPKPGI